MTHQLNVAGGREVLARWCNLAEQRLEYLTDLFETGRWRRYHSEQAFLENIQEAKAAVETWRSLSAREASLDNSAIDVSWLAQPNAVSPLPETIPDQVPVTSPLEIQDEQPSPDVSAAPDAEPVWSNAESFVSTIEHAPEPAPHIGAIEQRYPLLRNAL